jgi:hypothetical protein
VLGMVWTVCGAALSHRLREGGHWALKSVCGRQVCLPACAQPVFSDIHMPHVRAHV